MATTVGPENPGSEEGLGAGQQTSRKPQRIVLTDKHIQALKPAPKGQRVTEWDALVPGLGIRFSDKALGGKAANVAFVVMRRLPGETTPIRITLGRYHREAMPLAKAREEARKVLGDIAAGKNPSDEKRRQQREQARLCADTFEAMAERFCRELVSGLIPKARGEGELRDPEAVAAIVRRELIPEWKDRPVGEITKRDVTDLIVGIRARAVKRPEAGKRRKSGGPHAARHAFNTARRLFDWAAERGVIEDSPCDGIRGKKVHGPTGARDRVLTDDELRRVWKAAQATPYPYGALVQLLILTGQRRNELSEARWSEVDMEAAVITIPGERMKAGVAHTVPLTPQAVALLRELPRFTGDYIFSTTGGQKPFSGHSKAKARLDLLVGDIPPYQVHDLRRTTRTGMARAGVSVFVGELVISHRQSGVHAVYDLHGYNDEKRAALMTWEARLRSLIDPPPANVVPMREVAAS